MFSRLMDRNDLRSTLFRWGLLAVLFIANLVYALSAEAAEWSTYTHDEYGFSVDYPLNTFDTRKVAESGNGITLESNDQTVEFRAYGFENGDELSLKTVQDIILEDSDGRDVTYKRIKDKWIVLSGFEQEGDRRMIFYQRLQASDDLSKFSAFEMIYPESERATYDPMLKRMSLSLTAPTR